MDYRALVRQAASEAGLDPNIAEAVLHRESAGNPNAVSSKGATGLMQLMPATARELGVDPRDPIQNIKGGVTYLKQQIDKFGVPGGIAAYNAGPGRVSKTNSFQELPAETQAYVPAVMNRAALLAAKGGTMTDSAIQSPRSLGITDYIGAFEKAKAADDQGALSEIGTALQAQFDSALEKAKAAGDQAAVDELTAAKSKYTFGKPAVEAPKVPQPSVAAPVKAPTPAATVVDSKKPGNDYIDLGKRGLRALDDAVRGAADTLTFGYADEIAAKMDSLFGGGQSGKTNYNDALAAQRLRDKEGGAARIAGQVAGAVVAPAGVASSMATGSRALRAGAGALTGGAQGALYGAGTAEGDLNSRIEGAKQGALVGAALGGVTAGILPATVTQKGSTFINKAGSDADAALNAEIAIRARQEFLNPARAVNGTMPPMGAKELNAKVTNSFLREGIDVINQLPKDSPVRKPFLDALRRGVGNTQDELEKLSALPGGQSIVEIINKAQRADKLTAAMPADNNLLVKGIRIGADYALPGIISKPLNYLLNNRKTREEVGKGVVKQGGEIAENVIERVGPSAATTALDDLAAMAQKAQAARQAQIAAAQAARASGKAPKPENVNAAISELQAKDPTYLLGLSNRFGSPRNETEMAEFSKLLRQQIEARLAKQQLAREAARQGATAAPASARNEVLAASRTPLGGGFQELLQGGRSGLNMTTDQAIDSLRLVSKMSKDTPIGQAASAMLKSREVTDADAFYGVQNLIRRLSEEGRVPGVSPVAGPGALSSGIRNPISYAANVKNAEEALRLARESAPNGGLAQFASSVGRIKNSAEKLKAVEERLAKATDPAEVEFLNTFVKPLANFGKK